MKNCLVTKLKANIGNRQLPIFDGFRMYYNIPQNAQTTEQYFKINSDDTVYTVSIIGDDKFLTYNGNAVKSFSAANPYFYLPTGEFILVISSKYKVDFYNGEQYWNTGILASNTNGYSVEIPTEDIAHASRFVLVNPLAPYPKISFIGNVEEMVECPNLKFICGLNNKLSGDLGNFAGSTNIEHFIIQFSSSIKGTLQNIASIAPNLKVLNLYYAGNFSGNVSAFVNNVGISKFRIAGCGNISGDLDSLFNAWATAGKTGTIDVYIGNFEGQNISTTVTKGQEVQIKFENSSWSQIN
jgi:hypothetical protein